jgi:hypothetical protein
MSTQPYREDDEDLFNYEPSKIDSSSTYSSDQVSASSNQTTDNTLLDDIYRQMDEMVNLEGKESVSEFRIRLSDSLNEAYQEYVSKSSVIAHVQSVSIVLDEITNNRFSQVYFYKTVEQSIIRRINIHFLLSAIVEDDGEDYISFKDFLGKMNISISDDFIPVYFRTLLSISNHTLNIERAMYMDLSQKLGFTPNPVAIHDDPTASDILNAIPHTVKQYKETIYNSVFDSLANSDTFSQSVKNLFAADTVIKIATI